MAMTVKNNVIKLTADNDTYGNAALKKLRFIGARLIAGADAATAQIKITDTNGQTVMSLKAAAAGVDESNIPFQVDGGVVHVDMTGTAPELYLYLE